MSSESVQTPHEPRVVSEKRREASRQNGGKSNGPKTAEGKANSSKNSYKHGFRSRAVILPNEDTDLYDSRRDELFKAFRPIDAAEALMVDHIAAMGWRLERTMLNDTAILTKKLSDSRMLHDVERADEVRENVRGLATDPDHYSRMLRMTSHGCRWAAGRLETMAQTLEKRGFMYPTELDLVLNIFGLRTQDLFVNALAFDIIHAFLIAGWSTGGDMTRVQALIRSPAPDGMSSWEYRHRVDGLAKMVNGADPEPGKAELIALFRSEAARLQRHIEALTPNEDYLRVTTLTRASVDTSEDGQLRMRYDAMHRRDFRNAIKDLHNHRKAMAANPIDPEIPVYEGPPAPEPKAPNEPEKSPAQKVEPEPEAKPEVYRGAPMNTIPDLEEPADDAKRPLGVPPGSLEELLDFRSPDPVALEGWADEIEAERERVKNEMEMEM